MASIHSDQDQDVPPQMDYREHERTYKGFITITKWVVILLALSMVALFFLVQP